MSSSITAFFDFETYNITQYKFGIEDKSLWDKLEKTDKPAAVYGAGLLWENQPYLFFGPNALDEWWNKLKQLGKGKKITLIAHNCAYDFAFINEYIHTRDCKIKSINAAQTDDSRSWLWAKINVDDLDIVFKDTWIWDKNCSLKLYSNIIQSKKTKKGKLEDYEKWNFFEENGRYYFYDKDGNKKELDIEAERQYLLDDILLLPLVKEYIFKTKKLLLNSGLLPNEEEWIHPFEFLQGRLTKSSFAKACLENATGEFFYQGFKLPLYDNEPFYRQQNKSYIGGFTAGNRYIDKLDLEEEKITSYDVNSMYPSIMADLLPYGPALNTPPKGKPYCTWYLITGTSCEYKKEYDFLDCPIISTKFQDWLDSNNNIEGYTPTYIIEKSYFDIINKYTNNNLEIVDELYQELTDKCSEAIREGYELRLVYKKTNPDVDASIKLFLNSVFGKFSEKTHEYIIKWEEDKVCWEKQLSEDAGKFTYLLTGLYITSRARVKLMEAIKQEVDRGNTFLYADTDSIKFVEDIPVQLEIHPTKLGAWKAEGKFNIWRYPLKRKRYYCLNTFTGEEKFASGGFHKNIIEDLSPEEKKIFFDSKLNIIVKKGKKLRYLGDYLDLSLDKKGNVKRGVIEKNRYGITKIFEVDISTTNSLKNPDKIIEHIDGKWTLRDV